MKSAITKIQAREILDSRGNPTVETTIWAGKVYAAAGVPSGASTGIHEAVEIRDNDKKRYAGKGVLLACRNVNGGIAKKVIGTSALEQENIDRTMIVLDGTENKSKLGANAILSVSLAAAKLAAKLANFEPYQYLAKKYGYTLGKMPIPLFNVINGGVHADSGLDIQEFSIIPKPEKFSQQLRKAVDVTQCIRHDLRGRGYSIGVGDEGGFAPHLKSNTEAVKELARAIKEAGYKLGQDFTIGIDAAASEFYNKQKSQYTLKVDGKKYTNKTLFRLYDQWIKHYHISMLEDGGAEDDFAAWRDLMQRFGKRTLIVGDDLFVTNVGRIRTGIEKHLANAAIIKLNQIGTLTETIEAIKLCQQNHLKIIVAHRSGETNDDFIADLSVAVGAEFIKAGAPARGERVAKYNRLLAIEAQMK